MKTITGDSGERDPMLQVGRDFNSVRLVNRTFQINPEACIVAVVSLAGDVEMTGHFAWNERYLVQPQGVRTSVREPIVLKGAPLENPLAPRQTELPLRPSTVDQRTCKATLLPFGEVTRNCP